MASVQNYQSHRHNPILTSIAYLLGMGALVWFIVAMQRDRSLVPGLILLALAVLVLAQISRTYTTRLQDRIIKLEMLTRCRDLLGPDAARTLARLKKPQIVALRFASDEELPALIERAEKESMSADAIKRAIKTWRPDWDRT